MPVVQDGVVAQIAALAVLRLRHESVPQAPLLHKLSLEALDWLPPEKLGGNQDELHQATWRASDVSHF